MEIRHFLLFRILYLVIIEHSLHIQLMTCFPYISSHAYIRNNHSFKEGRQKSFLLNLADMNIVSATQCHFSLYKVRQFTIAYSPTKFPSLDLKSPVSFCGMALITYLESKEQRHMMISHAISHGTVTMGGSSSGLCCENRGFSLSLNSIGMQG